MKLMFGWLMRKLLGSIRLSFLGGSETLGFGIVVVGKGCLIARVYLDCCLEVGQAERKDSFD
jgi:hypothetical protein